MWKDVLKVMLDALRVATWQTAPWRDGKMSDIGETRRR